jgi:diamine N-acetyltransferase
VAVPRVELHPTDEGDLPWILAAEARARADGFVQGWDEATHRRALADPGTAYRMIREPGHAEPAGYAILCGLDDTANRCIELKRFVVVASGRGLGRAAFRALMHLAFGELGAHRFWLDVFTDNPRARHLYRSEGLVEEGVMRECVRREDGRASLVLMSMLAHEYAAG